MIEEMPCGYGIIRTTGVRIRLQVSRWGCAKVSAALEVCSRPAQRSQQLQKLTIVIVKSRSILNTSPSLQVLSGARENALAESESTVPSSKGGWENLEVVETIGEGYRSVWEVCVWLLDWITFCWWSVLEDVECKLRCVNFRRVLDPRRAFLPAFRVGGSADNNPRSADGKPASTFASPGWSWERMRHAWKLLES